MSQFTKHGYSKIRNYIKNTFTHVALTNNVDEVLRVNNAAITTNDDTVSYTVQITNVDDSLTNQTVNKASIFETSSDNDAIASVTFSDFKFESVEDVLTLTINIQVPQV